MSLSPMMKQYLQMKDDCKDSLLFFRLGDFYELFFDDAITVSRELDLVLTGKSCGLPERAPMCGIPYHAVDTYLTKLIQKGYKVTICEQTTPVNKKGIMRREVTRIVTPGTVTESSMLTADKNNYLVSIYYANSGVGVSWADISTGEFNHTYIDGQISVGLNDLLARIEPVEIICNQDMLAESIQLSIVKYGAVCPFSAYDETAYEYDNAANILRTQLSEENLQRIDNKHCICAAGALLAYIKDTQKCALTHINKLNRDESEKHMLIDANTRRTLELTQSFSGKKNHSLFGCINRTRTGMGARLLKKWIEQPEIDVSIINSRLDFVQELTDHPVNCKNLYGILSSIHDIERLTARLSAHKILPIELLTLSASLRSIVSLKQQLQAIGSESAFRIDEQLLVFDEICDLLERAIRDFNKTTTATDKKKKEKVSHSIFNKGYDADLDEYRNLIENTRSVLEQLVCAEKEETGIKNIKIGFNNIFGYYLEVPKSQADSVPYRYVRKQTVANAERYVTEELKELEDKILHAEELSVERENKLYEDLTAKLQLKIEDFLSVAQTIAMLDCVVSFAIISQERNYIRPIVNNNATIKIREGRHPVVETLLKDETFVPNDTLVDSDENKIMLITGPNMAGKSIYMKQVALITVMAHMGCFIPAAVAEIGVVDRIFTRVGANDDLSSGRSTFMVEMSEVTDILKNATDNSLILMDEIGRGTSTFDGLSIAWSIIEYLSVNLKAKVLFSTHYHELTDLEGALSGIKNYKLTVRELNNPIIFLRKLMRGSANRSFGIEVASLTGLPDTVVARAKELLKRLEMSDLHKETVATAGQQISLFAPEGKTHEIVRILQELDINETSPRAALDILIDLKEKATVNE